MIPVLLPRRRFTAVVCRPSLAQLPSGCAEARAYRCSAVQHAALAAHRQRDARAPKLPCHGQQLVTARILGLRFSINLTSCTPYSVEEVILQKNLRDVTAP